MRKTYHLSKEERDAIRCDRLYWNEVYKRLQQQADSVNCSLTQITVNPDKCDTCQFNIKFTMDGVLCGKGRGLINFFEDT